MDERFRRFLEYSLDYQLKKQGKKLLDGTDKSAIIDYLEMANEEGCYTPAEWIKDTEQNYPGEYIEEMK